MRIKLLLVLLVAAVSVLLIKQVASFSKVQDTVKNLREGQITRQVNKAKAEGKSEIEIGSGVDTVDYPVITAPDGARDLLSSYSLVVVQPKEKRSYAVDGDSRIVTWYKFRIKEKLSEGKTAGSYEPPLPQEMVPLQSDEILVLTEGGVVDVDGVKVRHKPADSPLFLLNKQYLLLVARHDSGYGELVVGPSGTFLLEHEGKFHPLKKTATSDLLMGTIGDSLTKTRSEVKKLLRQN